MNSLLIRTIVETFDTTTDWVEGYSSDTDRDYATKLGDDYIEIHYKSLNNFQKSVVVDFTRNNSHRITGEGNEFKIFGAVINHIYDFLKDNPQISTITFSASKPTGNFGVRDTARSGLYDKMVRVFAKKLGFDYSVHDFGFMNAYELKRKIKEATGAPAPQQEELPIDMNSIFRNIQRLEMQQVFTPEQGDALRRAISSLASNRKTLFPELILQYLTMMTG